LNEDNAWRARLAAIYLDRLQDCDGLILPHTAKGCNHVWHLFVVRHVARDRLQKQLAEKGVGTMIHYPVPPHLQPAYADLELAEGMLPISEQIHREVLSLPMGPTLQDDDVIEVCDRLRQAISEL